MIVIWLNVNHKILIDEDFGNLNLVTHVVNKVTRDRRVEVQLTMIELVIRKLDAVNDDDKNVEVTAPQELIA